MAEDTTSSFPTDRREGPGRGGRPQGNRDAGGFRIRLSDNELQAARALQEALGLRSTVAVLGFSLRTLAQQLEAGQLDELVASQRAQGGSSGGPGGGGERRRERPEGRDGGRDGGRPTRGPRIDPFARPSRPAPVVEASPADDESPAGHDGDIAADGPADAPEADVQAVDTTALETPALELQAVDEAPGDAGADA
jgi:hypothetical protein